MNSGQESCTSTKSSNCKNQKEKKIFFFQNHFETFTFFQISPDCSLLFEHRRLQQFNPELQEIGQNATVTVATGIDWTS